jgi:hypothetical protein
VIGSSLAIPLTAIDGVEEDDEVDKDDDDDEEEEEEEDDEDGPTGRARTCCRSKPASEQ